MGQVKDSLSFFQPPDHQGTCGTYVWIIYFSLKLFIDVTAIFDLHDLILIFDFGITLLIEKFSGPASKK